MGHVGDIKDPQASLPVGAVNEGPAVAWIVCVLARPGLNGHVVDVNPSAVGGLPRDLRLSHLHDSGQVSVPSEVEVGDGDATARLTGSNVTLLIIRVCDEDVPFAVNHVGVEVVRAARVVGVVPRVDIGRITLVSDIDQSHADLGRVTPLTDIGVRVSTVHYLVLYDDVFPAVVLEVLDVENLCVGIQIHPDNRRVVRVGDIDDVQLLPTGDVGVGVTVWAVRNLNLGVARLGQFIEGDELYVRGAEVMLGGILVVMLLILSERVDHLPRVVIGGVRCQPDNERVQSGAEQKEGQYRSGCNKPSIHASATDAVTFYLWVQPPRNNGEQRRSRLVLAAAVGLSSIPARNRSRSRCKYIHHHRTRGRTDCGFTATDVQ